MRVCILLGSTGISGGSFVVLQHAQALSESGHDVTLAITLPLCAPSDWHPALKRLRVVGVDELADEHFDVAVATWWQTVSHLPRIRATACCYFVQSLESRFYVGARGAALRRSAQGTYQLPMPVITEATWLKMHLERLGRSVQLVRNGVRKDVYSARGDTFAPRVPGRLRVLVEGPVGVLFKNVPRTVRTCARAGVGDVWLLTSSPVSRYPHVDRVFSQVSVADTARVYRSCDVVVKLSYVEGMFGPPLEMFHCGGTALTYDVTGHDEYLVDGINSLVVPTGDEAAVESALRRLQREPDLLMSLKAGAAGTAAAWPDWTDSSAEFENALVTAAARAPDSATLSALIGPNPASAGRGWARRLSAYVSQSAWRRELLMAPAVAALQYEVATRRARPAHMTREYAVPRL